MSGVLIVLFFRDVCFRAFICLVLLVDGFPSLPFFIYMVFLLLCKGDGYGSFTTHADRDICFTRLIIERVTLVGKDVC